ncbi:MAG: hypothetical protein GQ570_08610 [Helicobacteraceae bacterium]|nr:hypothetical protein [Helicobacteraceae bacterium]
MATLNTKFTTYFGEFEAKMIATDSVYEKTIASVTTAFDEFTLTPEQKAEFIIQARIQALSAVLQSATSATIEIIKEEKNQDKIDADIALVNETKLTQAQATLKTAKEVLKVEADTIKVERDTQGYDDQMIMKMVTEQASVASFAVNSGSDTAQTALDNLKCLMTQVLARTSAVNGETVCVLDDTTPPV